MKAGILASGAVLAIGVATAAQAQRADCDALWEQRNAIFKSAGYCFKTSDAIRRFGNAGCRYDDPDDVPLSARDRRIVADLQAAERRYGCRR
jgi:hypothetical protein